MAGRAEPGPGPARIAILGLGLIGGSIARALAQLPADRRPEVAAWSPTAGGPIAARAEGVVSAILADPGEAWTAADLVVLAAPPLACLELLDTLAATRPDDAEATVTDVASTKERLAARADELGLRFVGGHPMAGREVSGFGSADAGLFVGRPWVVVPGRLARPIDVARVEALALLVGAGPIVMEPALHDATVAAISHLPLAVAIALVEAVVGVPGGPDREGWPVARSLAASGWTGMTRLARGDVEMSVGILATNAAATAGRLRDLRVVLDDWLDELERPGGPDVPRLRERVRAARERLGEAPSPPPSADAPASPGDADR